MLLKCDIRDLYYYYWNFLMLPGLILCRHFVYKKDGATHWAKSPQFPRTSWQAYCHCHFYFNFNFTSGGLNFDDWVTLMVSDWQGLKPETLPFLKTSLERNLLLMNSTDTFTVQNICVTVLFQVVMNYCNGCNRQVLSFLTICGTGLVPN